MVEVFATNVVQQKEAKGILSLLYQHFPESYINFDLQDCDKILRLEGQKISVEKVVALVQSKGYSCQPLP